MRVLNKIKHQLRNFGIISLVLLGMNHYFENYRFSIDHFSHSTTSSKQTIKSNHKIRNAAVPYAFINAWTFEKVIQLKANTIKFIITNTLPIKPNLSYSNSNKTKSNTHLYIFITCLGLFGILTYFRERHHSQIKNKLQGKYDELHAKIHSLNTSNKTQNISANKNLKFFKDSLHNVYNPALICRTDGTIEWINYSYCKNQKTYDLLHRNFLSIENDKALNHIFSKCIQDKISYTYSPENKSNQYDFWIEISLNPILNQNNEVSHLAIIKHKSANLEDLNETRDILMSVLTHDLKSPLLAFKMLSASSIKQLQNNNTAHLKDVLQELHDHSQQMYDLHYNLTDWIKSKKGSLYFFPQLFDLSATLYHVIDLYEVNAAHKGIKIISPNKKSIPVFADENMIKTVLRNLICNAIKFSVRNGRVQINATPTPKEVIVSISNIGVKNFQIDNAIIGDQCGGYGLIICKEFIKRNKGKIWSVERGKGTHIKFTIPAKQ